MEQNIAGFPSLIYADEAKRLKRELAGVAAGASLVLQGGECAETFADFQPETIHNNWRLLQHMAAVISYGSMQPVVKIGRMAGQFAKPRSGGVQCIGGVELPVFRGDIINGEAFTAGDRAAEPSRMETAYFRSAATLNVLRTLVARGESPLAAAHTWNIEFLSKVPFVDRYHQLAAGLRETVSFMAANNLAQATAGECFYTSHEALLLPYEEALTRRDSATGAWYDCSAHFLWIGDRTRQLDGAHVEFMRGIANPIGLKVGPSLQKDDLLRLVAALSPDNEPGRLTLICRFGAATIGERLPMLARAVMEEGFDVVWTCDPMHGNTTLTAENIKTRRFETIAAELRDFFAIHWSEGSYPGGLHLEMVGDDVTECLGGPSGIVESDLPKRYRSSCDPRLNAEQSLELAFLVASDLRDLRIGPLARLAPPAHGQADWTAALRA